MVGESGRALLRGGPQAGPLAPLAMLASRCLTAGDAGAALALAAAGAPVAERLGDTVTAHRLLGVQAWALLRLDRPGTAALQAGELAREAGTNPDPHTASGTVRALALAVVACAEAEAGDPAAALDALAEALAAVERPPSRGASLDLLQAHLEACCAVAAGLELVLLFEAAAELLDRTLARAQDAGRRGEPGGAPPAALVAVVLRRRLLVELTWCAHLELLGGPEAAARWPVLESLGLRLAATGRALGDEGLVASGAAAEVYALERRGAPALARARAAARSARAHGRGAPLVEWLPGRVALARALAALGETEQARVLLAKVRAECTAGHLRVWADLADLALAELAEGAASSAHDELTEPGGSTVGRSSPAGSGRTRGWRDVARAAHQRLWREREGRLADLRQRILREELTRRSSRSAGELLLDPLTGLGNRRRLEHAAGTRGSATVVFADLDSFKQINDSCGHAVGDEVLRRVAALLRASCRADDVVVRYGGDEFVVLVGDTSTASTIGERLLARVRGYDWAPITGGLQVTLSVGVSQAADLAGALRASDAAMLTAKRSGRDSLVHALPQVVRSAPGRPLRSPRPLPSLRPLRTLAAGPTRRRRPARPPAQRPEFGPFDLFAEWAHALYVEGRADEALVACAAGLLVVEPAGDRETARFLRYVACLVLAQQGRWSSLVRATQDHLDTLERDAGPYWRAKFLALHAMALVYLDRSAAALDVLAEAHGLVDVPGYAYNRASALMILAGSVRGALMFSAAVRLLDETEAASAHPYLRAQARLERAVVLALWGLVLELVGRADEAAQRFAECAGAAVAVQRACREHGLPPAVALQAESLLHVAFQRLGVPGVDAALLERHVAVAPARDGLLSRLALASMLAGEGDLDGAAAVARRVLDLAAREHEPVLAWVAAGRLAELDERAQGASEAGRRWRHVAVRALDRLYRDREGSFDAVLARRRVGQLAAQLAATEAGAAQDALTGVGNRRRLEELLATGQAAGGLVFLDIDDFKAVNDAHGHAAGDEVLRRVAAALQQAAGPGDVVTRFGGDEFVVVLAEGSDAPSSAARLRAAVGAVGWGEVARGLAVTVSAGAAPAGPRALAGADAELLAAKRARRQRPQRQNGRLRARMAGSPG